MPENNKFCYVPFYEMYYEDLPNNITNDSQGTFRNCCIQNKSFAQERIFTQDSDWFRMDPDLRRIRFDFLRGKKPKICSRCWLLESKGVKSYRQQWNLNYQGVPKPSSLKHTQLKTLDIRLSNKCNLHCKMCGMGSSNQIVKKFWEAHNAGIDVQINEDMNDPTNFNVVEYLQELSAYPNFIRNTKDNFLDDLLSFLDRYQSIENLKLAGGEPMIMPELEQFLQHLIDKGRTNLNILILTNMTTVKTSMVNKLEKFKKVNISGSVDGVGKWIEYQRSGCKWDVIDSNVDKLLETKLNVTLTPCWSHLNILSLPDFIQWVSTKPKLGKIPFNEVNYPSWLNWELIPLEYRNATIEKLQTIDFPSQFSEEYKKFINRFKTQHRKISDQEKKSLSKAIKIWDHNASVSYANMYEWANNLVD